MKYKLKLTGLSVALCLLLVGAATAQTDTATAKTVVSNSSNTDEIAAAARVPLENYLKGHATGDAEFMKKAFNPGAKIEGYSVNGKFISWTLDEYVKGMPGKPAADETQRKRWIENVQIAGNAAIATLLFDYPTIKITDYLLLLKINGEWKIVNKIFQGEMKTQPPK